MVVILDTGSSDLYFDAASAPACMATGRYSCRGGEFDPTASDTYNVIAESPAFNTSFGDGSTASGPFSSDTVCIGDVCIDNVQFGVATAVNSTTGYALSLMGLGYSENEATHLEYPNIPEVLKSAGVIESRLYSVFLNAFSETSGSILFGGIDTSKYTGALEVVNLLPTIVTDIVQVDQFVTSVTALRSNVGGTRNTIWDNGSPGVEAYQNDNTALPVLLDTGSAAWSVPETYYPYIAREFSFLDRQGYCRCSDVSEDDTLTLTFAATIDITVPATEFIVPLYNSTTNLPLIYDTSGAEACAFMIVPGEPTGYGFDTLGDAVLRSMYVVFDLDNGQTALAQAARDPGEPNIVTVPAGPSGIASALGRQASFEPASASQSFSVAAEISGGPTFSAETMSTTIGTATGTAAVPYDAQISNTAGAAGGGGGGGKGGSGGNGGSSSDAASGLVVPGMDWSVLWVGAVTCLGVGVGMGSVWL